MSTRPSPDTRGDLVERLQQIAHYLNQTRHPTGNLERVLQLVGETLEARAGAVVLTPTATRRSVVWSWGAHQQQILHVGEELLVGLAGQTGATARQATLPSSTQAAASEGVILSVPLCALQQALGVLVLFCQGQPALSMETTLAFLNATAAYLGLAYQTAVLQESLKTRPGATRHAGAAYVQPYDPDQIIGQSRIMRTIMRDLEQAAESRSTVLLRGESGTGKELAARALHKLSSRQQQPFVKLNCAALPESLLESELFGHERGAFTGAVKTRRGRFELADKGTLFLDEIGDMSLAMQVKLLRVLQERTFERVGGYRPITVDVRIIAATNVNLEEAVRLGRFREDLYYRLHVVPIVLPPLRERKEDIPLLVGHFLARFNSENGKGLKISSAAMDLIVEYGWPGNIRELENCLERMVVMARRDIVAPEDVPLPVNLHVPIVPMPGPLAETASALPKVVADIEREQLVTALQRCGGVQTRAAALLGITPRQLGYKLRKYHLSPKMLQP